MPAATEEDWPAEEAWPQDWPEVEEEVDELGNARLSGKGVVPSKRKEDCLRAKAKERAKEDCLKEKAKKKAKAKERVEKERAIRSSNNNKGVASGHRIHEKEEAPRLAGDVARPATKLQLAG